MKRFVISTALTLCSVLASFAASHPEVETPDLPPHHQAVAEADYQVFTGKMGADGDVFVMKLWVREDRVVGHCSFPKDGVIRELNGEKDPQSGWTTLRETVEGNTTGWWEFIDHANQISGAWSRSIDMLGSTAFSANSLDLEYDPMELVNDPVSGTYQIDGCKLRIQYIGGDQFAFHYDVKGVYGYTGSLNGVAGMYDSEFAVYKDGMACSLTFEFKDGKVILDEQDCREYRGSLAYFSGELALAD